jgi:hypothetical protein
MATIARFIAEIGADATALRRVFASSVRDASAFGRDMRTAVNTRPLVDTAKATAAGRDAGAGMVKAFTAKYDTDMAVAREAFARKAIDARQFARAGEAAAVEFNREVLNGIADLRAHKMLPADVHAKLVGELKDAGLEAGRVAREQIAKEIADVDRALRARGRQLQEVGRNVSSAGRTATATVTTPLVGAGVFAVKEATDAAEAYNKFDVIFGRMADNVGARLAELHRTIPLTTAQLKEQAANFNALLRPMGFTAQAAADMSVGLVRLGGDIVSLNNTAQKETIDRLFSGLVGEAESIRRFGVDISEARLKTLAFDAGLGSNVQALTRAQKTTLIYNEIMRATSLAQGDAAATAGSASNSFRFLRRDASEAAEALGRQLLPTVVPLVQSLSRVLSVITRMSPQALDMAIKFALVAAAAGPVLIVLGSMISTVGTLTIAYAALRTMMLTAAAASAASAVATGGASAAGLGLAAVFGGPAGLILLIGAGVAALAGWIAYTTRAKQTTDELADSFRGLTGAQLTQKIQAESARRFALEQEIARLEARVPKNAVPVDPAIAAKTGQFTSPDVARLAAARREWEQTNDTVQGLAVAMNRVGAAAVDAQREQDRMFARADAAAAALGAMNTNALAESKAAAAAAKEARKDQIAFMSALAGTVSSLTDLHALGTRFGQDVSAVNVEAVSTYRVIQQELDKTGGRFDANTAKLLNMRAELLKLAAVAREHSLDLILRGDVGAIPLRNTPTAQQRRDEASARQGVNVVVQPVVAPITRNPFGPGSPINLPGGAGPGVVQAPPKATDVNVGRINDALDVAGRGLRAFGRSVQEQLLPISNALRQVVNPVYFFGSVLTEIASAIRPVLEPLRPVLALLARVVATTLAPVFEALAPVIEALIPIIRAVMQVLAPILQALVPLIRAFVPLLEALFPIFKLVAIAATYIGQAFGIAANIVLRAVGNIIIGFGKIIEVLARAVDALPFVSAKGAIRAAIEVQNFGRGMLRAGDEMKNLANDMAHAREEIRGVQLGTVEDAQNAAADGAQNLADATNAAAESLLFVPQIFRFRARLVEQWAPRELPQPLGTPPGRPADARPTLPVTPPTVAPPVAAAAAPTFIIHGGVVVQTSGDGEETLDNLTSTARRRAMAEFGTTTRAGEVLGG